MADIIDTLDVLVNQVAPNIRGLQRDMRNNATGWKAAAQAQSVPVGTLAQWMNDAAVAYQSRLAWVTTLQANTAAWNQLSAMWTILGGTGADFNTKMNPINTVANQLAPAAKTTYAQIIGICDQILAGVPAPLSLWPE